MFPLPLTAFEELMVRDRAFPMDIWIELCFRDRLSVPALEEALEVLASRHPLLVAGVEKIGGRFCWVPSASAIPLVRVAGGAWQPEPVLPEAGGGVRFYLVERSGECSLFLQVHHACCDGAAIRVVLLDLVTLYARLTDPQGPWPELTRLEPALLPMRGRIPPPPPIKTPRNELLELFRFLFPWPQALSSQPGPGGDLPFSQRVLSREETEAVLQRAARSGGRFHEQALSDLFAVLADWQVAHGKSRPGSRLRILIPMDVRELVDRRLPACNRVTFAFLTRRLDQCGPDLSQALRAEHEYIREYRTDLDFLRGLEFACAKRLLPLILRLPLPLSSAVLTNLGDVTPLRGFPVEEQGLRIGDAICLHASGATGVRPGTIASFSLCRLAGRLSIGLRCARPALSLDAENALLDAFKSRLLGLH
ncbi:MAG: hypothetical protein AMXMBFR33_39420 [Candidatus Xenobia bacterium]